MLQPGGRLIVIGYGNMGKAIVDGLTGARQLSGAPPLLERSRVVAVDPRAEASDVHIGRDFAAVAPLREGDALLLAVKPQVFPAVAASVAGALRSSTLALSVMAGITSQRISEALGRHARIVRAMPNTPAQIGQGATAFALGPGATAADAGAARAMLGALGPLVTQIDESLMDAFTAVAGSGPAYLFYFAEAMTAGAIKAGFDDQTADAVVRQTLLGSAMLLASDSRTSPAELRARVTSKGGTTEAALNTLADGKVHQAVVSAILAAGDRGRELGSR